MKRAVTTIIAAGALLALGALSAQAAEKAAAFPPAPPKVSPIQGAIDFHVHSAPDVAATRRADIPHFIWQSHSHGLVQLPIAA